MNRSALRNLIRNLVAAAIPLGMACSHDSGLPGVDTPMDMARGPDLAQPVDQACMPLMVADMSAGVWRNDFGVGNGGPPYWRLVDGGYPADAYYGSPVCDRVCGPGVLCHVVQEACGQTIFQCQIPGFGR